MCFAIASVVIASMLSHADVAGDDTLRLYLSKSTLVISGAIVNRPVPTTSEYGVCRVGLRVKVDKIFKGECEDKELKVGITRFQLGMSEMPPCIKEGGKVILFLRRTVINGVETKSWEQADPWFGVQQYNSMMAASLERPEE